MDSFFAIPLLHDQRKIQEPYYNKSHIVPETITNTKRVLLKKERVNAEKKYCSGHTTRIYAVQWLAESTEVIASKDPITVPEY